MFLFSIAYTLSQELKGIIVEGKGSITAAFAIHSAISPEKYHKMTCKLIRFLIGGQHPISTTFSELFREFCSSLHQAYFPPGIDTLNSIIMNLYEKVRILVSNCNLLCFGSPRL